MLQNVYRQSPDGDREIFLILCCGVKRGLTVRVETPETWHSNEELPPDSIIRDFVALYASTVNTDYRRPVHIFCGPTQCVGTATAMATWLCGCHCVCHVNVLPPKWLSRSSCDLHHILAHSSFSTPSVNTRARGDPPHCERQMKWCRYAMLEIRRASPLPSDEVKWRSFSFYFTRGLHIGICVAIQQNVYRQSPDGDTERFIVM